MSDFPTLYPNSITFTHGVPQVSEYTSFGVGPIRFRNTDFVNGQTFTFTYESVQQTVVDQIRNHYNAVMGTAGTFSVPTALFGGVSITDSASEYRYVDTPQEEHFGVYFNLTLTIQAISGIQATFVLDAGDATLPAEQPFNKYVFNGTEPFTLNGSTPALATLLLNGT